MTPKKIWALENVVGVTPSPLLLLGPPWPGVVALKRVLCKGEIEQFDKWLMFNRIVSDTLQYLEPFNFGDLYQIELIGIELFVRLTVCIYKMCLQIIYWIYM